MEKFIYWASILMVGVMAALVAYVWFLADPSTPMAPLRTLMYWFAGTFVFIRAWATSRRNEKFLRRTHHHTHYTDGCKHY